MVIAAIAAVVQAVAAVAKAIARVILVLKLRTTVIAILATVVLCFSQLAFAAAPNVSTNPSFSLDFSDASKRSGLTWTDQVAGLSAATTGTQYLTDFGGVESFTTSASYLDFGKPAIGSAINPTSDISAEVWIKFNAFNVNWNIFLTHWFDDLAGNSVANDFHFSVYTDGVAPRQLNLYTTGKFDLRGTSTIVTGKWYHFAFSVDNTSATKRIELYVNGIRETVYTQSASVRTANTNNRFIVGDARAVTSPNGQIAKVRLYNRALTATEMKSNFDADRINYGFVPTLNLSVPAATYRTSQTITLTSTHAGIASFYANNKVIPGCIKKAISTSVTCNWKPSLHGRNTIKANVIPTDTTIAPGSTQTISLVNQRANRR